MKTTAAPDAPDLRAVTESHDALIAAKAFALRCDVIEMVFAAGSGHLGGSLSSAEIVAALYWDVMNIRPDQPSWPNRDRLVLSKGHCAPIVYAALANRGYFDRDVLATFRKTGSRLQGHPDWRKTIGLDMTSGSLGQGLSVGLGMALASRQSRVPFDVYVLMSDGEMQEGMTWEAAMAAAHYGMGNLTVIVDKNGLQVDGFVADVMGIEPLASKWRAFGWRVITADGNDVSSVLDAFKRRRAGRSKRPTVIIASTIKGKGVSFMENVMEWHGGTLSPELYEKAMAELLPHAGGHVRGLRGPSEV
jgi:transketolase